ncbi:MAG TPA: response regulator transcription factor [Candidatus Sabulitectum sp.]|nr:response regulator transcription factor [Candidatus Sabulitectum sp.]HPF32386.1 response regulator transcription factor [Candidatus Sabulitectum sp.]HPJ29240.1 response regulator transcription factor [Candidatus Sabulitectum sp.]HPR23059.1 response regulator transcription factor [Candidatus Sabulitectum sp.]HRW77298.1 response regulator transcription factor [Candidatus Sabulitectum sp.]
MQEKILLVEDDVPLASLLSEYLASRGYAVEVLHKGSEVKKTVFARRPDLLILDLMLPDMNGLDICRSLREGWRGPILMLTAMKDDIDVVTGLEMGADDYLGKPVAPRVLLARVRALLRRSSTDLEAEMIEAGPLSINIPSRKASLNGTLLELTTTEFDLLALLARRAGRVQQRSVLVEELRGIDFDSFDRSVDVLVSRLRRKLGEHGHLIKTVRGLGYLLSPQGSQ